MIRVKFIAQGANSALGSFQSGDIARVSETFARHLVEEARVAIYLDAAPAAAAPQETTADPVDNAEIKPKTTRRKKSAKE